MDTILELSSEFSQSFVVLFVRDVDSGIGHISHNNVGLPKTYRCDMPEMCRDENKFCFSSFFALFLPEVMEEVFKVNASHFVSDGGIKNEPQIVRHLFI